MTTEVTTPGFEPPEVYTPPPTEVTPGVEPPEAYIPPKAPPPEEVFPEPGVPLPPPKGVAPPIPEPTYPKDVKPDVAGGQVATVKGKEVYIPGSTMYEMGFRTEQEYRDAQARGASFGTHPGKSVPKESVIVRDTIGGRATHIRVSPGDPTSPFLLGRVRKKQYQVPLKAPTGDVLLSSAAAESLAKLKGEAQFKKMLELGLIEKGAEFVPGVGEKWSYFPATEVAKRKAFVKAHIQLADGKWMLIKDWNKVPAEYKTIGLRQGFTAMKKAMEKAKIKPPKPPARVPTLPPPPTPPTAREKELMVERVKRERVRKVGEFLIYKPPTKAELKILRERLGLTKEDIDAARKAYLEAPVLEGGKPPKVRLDLFAPALAMADIDPEIANLPLQERWARVWEAVFNAEKARVKEGTEGVAASGTIILTDLRSQLKDKVAGVPAFIRLPGEFLGGLAIGAVIAAPVYTTVFIGNLVQCAWAPDKIEATKDLGTGVARFFTSIPAMVAAEPALATGELVGMFFVGPRGALKIASATKAKLSPHFIPERGIAIEYSVSRVPTKIVSEAAVMKAVNQAIAKALTDPQGKATVRIGNGRVDLSLRSTPVSEVVGPALYHATPLITKDLLRGKVKGELYTSPQAAPRFADSSAKGTPGTKPAIMMIYPKKGNPKWKPTSVFYKGSKEIEAVYPTIGLTRVKNLNSRIFGANAGEFITVHKGEAIPIYRFAEPGAVVPRFGIAELLAVRVKTIQATLVDLVKGKKGFEIIKVEKLTAIRARIAKDIKAEIGKGKSYETAVEVVKRRELQRLYSVNPKALERLYRERGERFEREYMLALERAFREARKELWTPIRIRPETARERMAIKARERFEAEREREAREVTERRKIERGRELREIPVERVVERIEKERIELREERLRKERLRDEIIKEEEIILEKAVFKRGASDKKKRKIIKDADGAIAWRHGELHKKDVFQVGIFPYEGNEYWTTVVGKKPAGATIIKGVGSAYQSVKLLYGKAPASKITGDLGFFDWSIEPTGKRQVTIRFKADPKMLTTGDITLGRRTPPITDRRPALSNRGKGFRITPRTPALRR